MVGVTDPFDGSMLPSFKDFVKDATSMEDLKTFAFKTKVMMLKLEHSVKSAKKRESIFWHLASHGIPKSLNCLCLKLAEEYAVNAMARSPLPKPQSAYRLTSPYFHHVILLTDNVLAASVVVTSTIESSSHPEKLVFHVVTDKKTYSSMHAWFALNSLITSSSAIVEVKGLHQYDWSRELDVSVKEMLDIHRLIWKQYNFNNIQQQQQDDHHVLSPAYLSLLNHLRIYIPEMFPELDRVLFLDDDVVVQHDLSSLFEMDLNGKVIGAVFDSPGCSTNGGRHECCPGRMYKNYFNFSQTVISSKFAQDDACGWLYGTNIFDLQAWRKTNVTRAYHQWLKLNVKSGLALWEAGTLAPAMLAFEGYVHPIESSWHVAGLGSRFLPEELLVINLEKVAVLHYSGPAKPWLEVGVPELRTIWWRYVNVTNEYIRNCRINY
ncbi:probable galacturonosyltransferase 15 isoform X2 [Impatiens glandulifera]|nr:probable galacturonosyltransferase 15 isoform X2 [Impatiens glandulifera]